MNCSNFVLPTLHSSNYYGQTYFVYKKNFPVESTFKTLKHKANINIAIVQNIFNPYLFYDKKKEAYKLKIKHIKNTTTNKLFNLYISLRKTMIRLIPVYKYLYIYFL